MSQDSALTRLINEPKGKVEYTKGEAFLLHVFWECPGLSAAIELLQALERCAAATHRDTPCVPIYLFRISGNDGDLYPHPPRTIQDHPALQAALRKLRLGVPQQAVFADLARQNLDAQLLELDPLTVLPDYLRERPIVVECTELYLDERAFLEHAGSRDYLAAYGAVMNPALRTRHTTIRLGTPTAYLIERVLEPMLRENVMPVSYGSSIWRTPASQMSAVMLSLDFFMPLNNLNELHTIDPECFHGSAVLKVLFQHPLRELTFRYMAVISDFRQLDLSGLQALRIERGEVHCEEATAEAVMKAVETAGLTDCLKVNQTKCVGYILHCRAHELVEL